MSENNKEKMGYVNDTPILSGEDAEKFNKAFLDAANNCVVSEELEKVTTAAAKFVSNKMREKKPNIRGVKKPKSKTKAANKEAAKKFEDAVMNVRQCNRALEEANKASRMAVTYDIGPFIRKYTKQLKKHFYIRMSNAPYYDIFMVSSVRIVNNGNRQIDIVFHFDNILTLEKEGESCKVTGVGNGGKEFNKRPTMTITLYDVDMQNIAHGLKQNGQIKRRFKHTISKKVTHALIKQIRDVVSFGSKIIGDFDKKRRNNDKETK